MATKDRRETLFGMDPTPTVFIDGKTYRGALPPGQTAAILDRIAA